MRPASSEAYDDLHVLFFFFNDTATTEIYTLSLHDALPIWLRRGDPRLRDARRRAHDRARVAFAARLLPADRKSTRLNSSHGYISYAVFCLKKKKNKTEQELSRQPVVE